MSETTKKKQTGATNAAQVGKTNQAIIDFIRNCSPFEADAFRIMVGVADGKAKIESLEASEADILNSYLNHGCFKDGTDERKLEKHRRERALPLQKNNINRIKIEQKLIRTFVVERTD